MKNIKENIQKLKSSWGSVKEFITLLKERKWLTACKKIYGFLKSIYTDHLKGKYVTVRGKRIPRTLIAVMAVAVIYLVFPSAEERPTGEQSIAEMENVQKTTNTYDENGIKVYELHKCEVENKPAACGRLENYGDDDYSSVVVTVVFHANDGTAIYEGGIEASDVESHTRMRINIPCPDEFSYFELKGVSAEK